MKQKNKKRSVAFSLIEVVITLGIFATGLVVLVGVLPQNLNSMRTSSAKSLERRIAQNIIGELMLNDWDKVHLFGAQNGSLRFFDAQGVEMQGFDTKSTIFTARIKVLPRDVNLDQNRSLESVAVSDALNYKLPDDEEILKSTNQHARRIVVEVVDIPDENFDFDDPENKRHILRVGTVVANLNEFNL